MKLRFVALNAVVMVVAALAVHSIKQDVRAERAEIERLLAERDAARDAVSVLRNEVAYLERPERLRQLAEEYLGLSPANPAHVVGVDDAGVVLAQIRHRSQPTPLMLTGGGW